MDLLPSFDLIEHGREERNLEYKETLNWEDSSTKGKIAKSAMAMANIPDGGAIVIAVEENSEVFDPVGMKPEDYESFGQDDTQDWVNGYADPFVQLTVQREEAADGKKFVVIQIQQFKALPVVCTKSGVEGLRSGAVYTRSRRKYQTVEVSSQTEMRGILDRATDKQILELRRRGILLSSAESLPETVAGHSEKFDKQLSGL